MVVEKFKNGDAKSVYQRFQEKGRMMPEGLIYRESWVDAGFNRCFQLMECDDASLLQEWIFAWQDLVEFEVFPVVESKTATKTAQKFL